jgi:hypothetical protein
MSEQREGFHQLNDELIAVKEQAAIAVYFNVSGGVTISKQRDWNEDDDTFIVTTTPEAARAVADAIYRELEANRPEGDALAPWRKDVASNSSNDRTAAERPRRRRKKTRSTGPAADLDHSTMETPTAELCGVLYGPEGPDEVNLHRDIDRDVTRDSHGVTLFEDRDAAVTSSARAAA